MRAHEAKLSTEEPEMTAAVEIQEKEFLRG
jgi:hypothetical protein